MPKVPQYNHQPLKIVHRYSDGSAPATLRQKNLILTLCERRKLNLPVITTLTKDQASTFISGLLDTPTY